MRLSEHELANEFAVSRTPIRQALQRLEYDGLAAARNGVGTIVTGLDDLAFQEIYQFRLRLSVMIGDFPAEAEIPGALGDVNLLRQRLQSLDNDRELEAFWVLNHGLHHATNRLIANKALRETHERYYFQASRIWYSVIHSFLSEQIEDFASELDETARALATGDVRAVGYIQRNHIAFGLLRVERARGD
ncbi:GntR family transcriptional regulator [Labrys sp. WJW]|nr:GntR family transcriptional regulator [Labrys sp. WJW]